MAYKTGKTILISGYVKANSGVANGTDILYITVGDGVQMIYPNMLFGAYGIDGKSARASAQNDANVIQLYFRIPSGNIDYFFFNAAFPLK